MSLESLVPPLEMCQQLKPGDFPESALVWRICKDGSYCPVERHFLSKNWKHPEELFFFPAPPAPTLAEIGEQLPGILIEFMVDYAIVKLTVQKSADDIYDIVEDNANPATAALRLWMRMNGREVKG